MTNVGDYYYVDFASKALLGFRNMIVSVEGLPELVRRYGHTDCFCTYFLFDRGLPDYAKQNRGSISGYQGQCYAKFLPLDIDGVNLAKAAQTAREITRYFLDDCSFPEQGIALYYSGMKGFHIYLATQVFGKVQPGTELPAVFREVRKSIVEQAKVTHTETIDFGISDRLRLLRLPNTRHSKSGLYKVPLHIEEMLSFEPQEILTVAQKPRPLWLTDKSGLLPRYHVDSVPEAVELLERSKENLEKSSQFYSDLPDPGSFLSNGDLNETLCQAELELYREGVPEGARSAMCLRFASRFRSAGYEKEEASGMVTSFAAKCNPPLDTYTARQIVAMAYRANGKGYQFGCGTGNGDPPQGRLVYERCEYKADRLKCDTFRQFYEQLNGNGAKGGGWD